MFVLDIARKVCSSQRNFSLTEHQPILNFIRDGANMQVLKTNTPELFLSEHAVLPGMWMRMMDRNPFLLVL